MEPCKLQRSIKATADYSIHKEQLSGFRDLNSYHYRNLLYDKLFTCKNTDKRKKDRAATAFKHCTSPTGHTVKSDLSYAKQSKNVKYDSWSGAGYGGD